MSNKTPAGRLPDPPALDGSAPRESTDQESTDRGSIPDKSSNQDATGGLEAAHARARTPEGVSKAGSLERGQAVIREHARHLGDGPGVYRMMDDQGDAIYVGKARSLRRRVTSYTQLSRLPTRLQRMVAQTARMEVVTTHTEVEALLLESNLIKRLRPRFNIQLRDDKSFPFILITTDQEVPRLTKHRGARAAGGTYYGPFASAGAVNRTITALQRAFLLRNCSDHVYANRTRPCLQYQIKRCTAPCVGYVDEAAYGEQVRAARRFLEGKSREVQAHFAEAMQTASETLDFETAALYRDRIRALSTIQQHQDINVAGLSDADVIAGHREGGQTCIQVFFFRGGQNYGNRAYYPSHDASESLPDILAAFIGQFYDDKPAPPEILVSEAPSEQDLLTEALSTRTGRKVHLHVPKRGDKRDLVGHALTNAKEALGRKLADSGAQQKLLAGLARTLELETTPQRIEVYDNSHIQGQNAVGAMIVATPEGFQKNAYRKFTIGKHKDKAAAGSGDDAPAPPSGGGDDYAMMREVLTRRFSRAIKEDPERTAGAWPDLVLIDGGKGQLTAAREVMTALEVDDIPVAAVAKGPERNAGRETIFQPGRDDGLTLAPNDPVLYYLQRLRDEAHRFVIGSHRQKRGREMARNPLDEIPGIGPKRKKALLHHFGSAKGVKRAGLDDLMAVDGVSEELARKIYQHFQES